MKILNCVLVAFLSLLALSCSQASKPSGRSNGFEVNAAAWGQDKGPLQFRRLESVTWNSVKHELKWDISTGERDGSGYRPHSNDRYEINMDNATMTVNGESRRFSEDEAANVRTLMDFISKYAVESTVWWEKGEGDPVDGREKPEGPKSEDRTKGRLVL